jgi:hypothetical protein
MQITIDRIDESYSLGTGQVETFLVLVLPGGERIRTAVDGDTARVVLEASRTTVQTPTIPTPAPLDNGASTEWDPPETFIDSYALPETEPPPPGEPTVNWEVLPEGVLSTAAKAVLRSANIDKTLTQSDFLSLRKQIMEKLAAQQIGEVQWNGGPRSNVMSVPRRTVPMDEKGNPLPPGGIGEADPGEVAEDEDGVESL